MTMKETQIITTMMVPSDHDHQENTSNNNSNGAR
jgi:hypothetical protein